MSQTRLNKCKQKVIETKLVLSNLHQEVLVFLQLDGFSFLSEVGLIIVKT